MTSSKHARDDERHHAACAARTGTRGADDEVLLRGAPPAHEHLALGERDERLDASAGRVTAVDVDIELDPRAGCRAPWLGVDTAKLIVPDAVSVTRTSVTSGAASWSPVTSATESGPGETHLPGRCSARCRRR